MLAITATEAWRTAHPGATIGLLEFSGVSNAEASSVLEPRKRETETRLRERYQAFTRPAILALPVMAAYEQYYKRFNKTYYVQLQLESVALKGKSLPAVSPLVDAYFMAELETFVLTAGHDVAKLQGSVLIDVSREGEAITQLNGTTKPIRAGDMVMRDEGGVCCSILYGQDSRSPISPATTHVLYVAYAPTGVSPESVHAQFQLIKEIIQPFSPGAVEVQQRLLAA